MQKQDDRYESPGAQLAIISLDHFEVINIPDEVTVKRFCDEHGLTSSKDNMFVELSSFQKGKWIVTPVRDVILQDKVSIFKVL